MRKQSNNTERETFDRTISFSCISLQQVNVIKKKKLEEDCTRLKET